MSFGYDNLRTRKQPKSEDKDDDIQLQVLIPGSVNGGHTHESISKESVMDVGNQVSEAESTDVELYSREDDKVTLIADGGDGDGGIDDQGMVKEYEIALNHLGFGLFHILLVICNGLALSSDAVEVLSISFVLPVISKPHELEALGLHDWQTALLGSVIFIGMLFGGYFWGGLADIVGRKRTLVMSLGVSGVFGLVSAFSPNFPLFLILRFCSGFGVGGSLPVLAPYISEFIRTKYRGPYLGIQSTFWMIGRLLCGAFAWIIIPQTGINFSLGLFQFHSWRLYLIVSAFPSLLGVIVYWLLPESPRFLLEVGRDKEAIKVLKWIHKLNHFRQRNPVYPVKGVLMIKRVSQGGNVFYKIKQIFQRTAELFHRELLRRTLLILAIMFCLSFGSYGVSLWYPTYVSQINKQKDVELFDKFCFDNVTGINSSAITDYCNCSGTVFQDSVISEVELNNWRVRDAIFDGVTFERVTFSSVSFVNTNFTNSSSFINCTFHNSQILNSFFDVVSFNSLSVFDSQFCGVVSTNATTVQGSLHFSNTSINNVNQTGNTSNLTELLVPDSVSRHNDSCAAGAVSEWPIQCPRKVNDFRVYRDGFFVSASALPGNLVSAMAVYFLIRKYWLAFVLLLSAASVFLLYVVHSEVFVVVVLCIFTGVSTPAWNDVGLIKTEVYPTHLRTTASGVHLMAARVGAIIGTNIFGEFIRVDPSIPILLITVVLLVGAISALPLPKTSRKTLLK